MIRRIFQKFKQVVYKRPFTSILLAYSFSILSFAYYYKMAYESDRNSFNVASDSLKKQIFYENNQSLKSDLKEIEIKRRKVLGQTITISHEIKAVEMFKKQLDTLTERTIKIKRVKVRRSIGGRVIDNPFELPFITTYIDEQFFLNPTYQSGISICKLNFKNDVINGQLKDFLRYNLYFSDGKGISIKKSDLRFNLNLLKNQIDSRELHLALITNCIEIMRSQVVELEKEENSIYLELRNISRLFNQANDNLTFGDFFYFSVITQSSTGYGDILPNKRSIRLAVSIQILISILLLSFTLSYLSTKNNA